jgi:UDP-glucose 4-epimerase
MDTKNDYLQDLISQAEAQGGVILQLNNQSRAVVLTVDAYNELVLKSNAVGESIPKKKKTVLVTGGAGYIGSHVVHDLLFHGFDVVVIDNLSTGRREAVPDEASFIEGDVSDPVILREVFNAYSIDAVMHFAATLTAATPDEFLKNNVFATHNLLAAMAEAGVVRIIFSSSAAVYGNASSVPTSETAAVDPLSPYGYSKMLAEQAISFYAAHKGFSATVFRYFNVCGAEPSGQLGPNPNTPALIPLIVKVALGKESKLVINGNAYSTFDGTQVRDFIHVLDVARALRLALEDTHDGYKVYNVGSGKGSSVEEVVRTAAEVLNRMIPIEVGPVRAGDPSISIADATLIDKEMGFKTEYSDLETILKTTWNYFSQVYKTAPK